MIVTIDSKINTLMRKNKILAIDDINSSNKEEIFSIIDNCDLYIDSKFSVPTINKVISKRSMVLNAMNELFDSLSNDIHAGKSKLFTNDTQLKNFKVKLLHWYRSEFSEVIDKLDNNEYTVIVINHELSKHEKIFIRLLADCGASVLLLNSNFDNDEVNNNIGLYSSSIRTEVQNINFGTTEKIEYKKEELEARRNKYKDIKYLYKYESLESVEQSLYNDNKIVKVIVRGMDNYIDTCNFYAKLYNMCMSDNSWMIFDKGFDKPTYKQTSAIPRLANSNNDYTLHTVLKFLELDDDLKLEISEIIRNIFKQPENKELSSEILYNKLVYIVCSINKIYEYEKPRCIIYYGVPSKNDLLILQVLAIIDNLSVIVACSDKSKTFSIDGLNLLELSTSNEVFPIPLIDKRDEASTIAANTEIKVNQTLFNGDTLGMYKPGQFRTCTTINFNTTYDEIKLWWNKDVYLRPGFKSNGIVAVVPTIFRVIKGCIGDNNTYLSEIQKYCCGRTVLCKNKTELSRLYENENKCRILRGTDVNGTRFEDQKPFFENGKLNKERIKSGLNYKYSFLDMNKQDMLLDKIEELIIGNKVNKNLFRTEQEFIDAVLNIGLNLSMNILQNIQWFEFYTYNPNLILLLKDQNMPDINNMILLALLQSLGFDMLIFVPTCYSSIESLVGPKFVYDTNIVGEANYEVDTDRLHVTSNIEIAEVNTEEQSKRHGFFSKLFGK